MSDLYNISLDHLLKEEKPMSDYLNYLEESTNTVRSKNKTVYDYFACNLSRNLGGFTYNVLVFY